MGDSVPVGGPRQDFLPIQSAENCYTCSSRRWGRRSDAADMYHQMEVNEMKMIYYMRSRCTPRGWNVELVGRITGNVLASYTGIRANHRGEAEREAERRFGERMTVVTTYRGRTAVQPARGGAA